MKKVIPFFISIVFLALISQAQEQNELAFFQSFDNTKIAYTDEGSGKPVVLIHGFIVDGSSWGRSTLKGILLENGYRVIIPDLRGNGNSDKPGEKEAYQNNAEIKDLMILADHLKLDEYLAVGYSRGSIILAKLLTEDKRITKAVLGGMGVDFTNPDWDRRIAFADAFTGRVAPTELTKGALDYANSIKADIRALGFLQDYQPLTSLKELSNIKTETLVICGDKDTDNGNPEALQQQLPNSQLVIVEGDHNNTYKQENFAKAVLSFLEE